MIVYRIARDKYIEDLTGTGAKLHGGRWNPKGISILYTAQNKSLAALELLVHLDKNSVPDDLQIISLEFPDNEIIVFDKKQYKKLIEDNNSLPKFKETGKTWILSNKSLGLKVPSVLIPGESNILINPAHKSFKKLKIKKIEQFNYDERFFI